ncbi:MAG: alanine racemase [Flavobacteriales bacterium]|nr:alanine racemase [Flavobacteriales bacterium]
MKELDKQHQTELQISLSAMRDNLNTFISFLKPETEIMLMLKAAAYGHGSTELAKLYEKEERISYYAVAYADEGVRLREAGIEKNILVLNPSSNAFEDIIHHCLEPEIHNLVLLNEFVEFLKSKKHGMAPYPIHLKFNTGMNRLGFDEGEIGQLKEILSNNELIRVRSIMTHLSSTNLPEEDEYSQAQLDAFSRIIDATKTLHQSDTFFHCLNSNGIFRFPNHQYDLVRLGIGFYGTSTVAELSEKIKPSSRFVSRVCQIRKVEKGDSISYSRSGRAPDDTRIATLSLGYADGFNRFSGNGRWQVEINGQLFPTIGNICMDLSMVDIGDADIKVGDEVVIFGGKKSIYEYADLLGTITYEVMCAIGPRVKKVVVD